MTSWWRVARIVLGGLTLLFAFTALYVAAFHAPRAKGIDVGVVGTAAQGPASRTASASRPRLPPRTAAKVTTS